MGHKEKLSMLSFLQTPSLDVIGQEALGVAVLVHSHVEYLKATVTMMMSVSAQRQL